jgi:hypothetical protein
MTLREGEEADSCGLAARIILDDAPASASPSVLPERGAPIGFAPLGRNPSDSAGPVEFGPGVASPGHATGSGNTLRTIGPGPRLASTLTDQAIADACR